ncbi:hypothetical protein C8R43DRAFT_1238159 [Mycena crocata]|nr:hypothetical protein C8R43DRAFT_1238159 [Mycena crocata]
MDNATVAAASLADISGSIVGTEIIIFVQGVWLFFVSGHMFTAHRHGCRSCHNGNLVSPPPETCRSTYPCVPHFSDVHPCHSSNDLSSHNNSLNLSRSSVRDARWLDGTACTGAELPEAENDAGAKYCCYNQPVGIFWRPLTRYSAIADTLLVNIQPPIQISTSPDLPLLLYMECEPQEGGVHTGTACPRCSSGRICGGISGIHFGPTRVPYLSGARSLTRP